MPELIIEAGTLTASRDDRIVTGLLVPYGELGRTNLGRFSVETGAFTLPEDPTVITVNVEHARETPVGRAITVTETPSGIVGTFSIAATPDGDAVLAGIEDGTRKALSAEVANVVIRGGKALAGQLFGAAVTKAGAFPSATLLASDVGDLPPDTDEHSESTSVVVIDGVEYIRKTTSTYTTTTEPVNKTEEEDEDMPEGTDILTASLPGGVRRPARPSSAMKSADDFYRALAGNAAQGGTPATLLAALDNAIQTDVAPAQQPAWLNEVWKSRTARLRYSSLFTAATLTALKGTGWKFSTGKTPDVAEYAGFPAQPYSNEVKTEAVTVTAKRLAGAGAIDRAFVDFSTPEFWAGYYREASNNYVRKLEAIALAYLIDPANSTPVTATTVPAGHEPVVSYILDGLFAVEDVAAADFAILGTDLYRSWIQTKEADKLAYLSVALGLDPEEGRFEQFKIVRATDPAFNGKVLVGATEAQTLFQLPGSPVRIDTVNISTGGVETGVFGYHAEFTANTAAFALVTPDAG